MTALGSTVDRPAAIRHALRDLVAENGFHGASMSAVARLAGVATGTAYVHYESKEELVYATYLEVKQELGAHILETVDLDAPPRERYGQMWQAIYQHLSAEPNRARFLTQMEESPFHEEAFRRLLDEGDVLVREASRPDLQEILVPLPPELIYPLSIGVAVRLAASGVEITAEQLDTLVEASWRAITR